MGIMIMHVYTYHLCQNDNAIEALYIYRAYEKMNRIYICM